jgi:hypothetical protein
MILDKKVLPSTKVHLEYFFLKTLDSISNAYHCGRCEVMIETQKVCGWRQGM